jgi:hypothetical protein
MVPVSGLPTARYNFMSAYYMSSFWILGSPYPFELIPALVPFDLIALGIFGYHSRPFDSGWSYVLIRTPGFLFFRGGIFLAIDNFLPPWRPRSLRLIQSFRISAWKNSLTARLQHSGFKKKELDRQRSLPHDSMVLPSLDQGALAQNNHIRFVTEPWNTRHYSFFQLSNSSDLFSERSLLVILLKQYFTV